MTTGTFSELPEKVKVELLLRQCRETEDKLQNQDRLNELVKELNAENGILTQRLGNARNATDFFNNITSRLANKLGVEVSVAVKQGKKGEDLLKVINSVVDGVKDEFERKYSKIY